MTTTTTQPTESPASNAVPRAQQGTVPPTDDVGQRKKLAASGAVLRPATNGLASGLIAGWFPPAFNVYRHAFTRVHTIGQRQGNTMMTLSLHSGLSGRPSVILHSGPTQDDKPLATAELYYFSNRIDLALHAAPGPSGRVDETMEHHRHFPCNSYAFSTEVGSRGRRETFEWKPSYGVAVLDLVGEFEGFVLVRQETGSPDGPEDDEFVPGGYKTKDGKEIVAVWSDVEFSFSKVATFQFLGSGATGILGDRWTIMAVISAMALFERGRRNQSQAGVASF